MLNVVLGRFLASEETELVSACFAPNNDSIVWFSQITWMGGVSFQKAFELFGPSDDDQTTTAVVTKSLLVLWKCTGQQLSDLCWVYGLTATHLGSYSIKY